MNIHETISSVITFKIPVLSLVTAIRMLLFSHYLTNRFVGGILSRCHQTNEVLAFFSVAFNSIEITRFGDLWRFFLAQTFELAFLNVL